MNSALLIIDMQNAFLNEYHDSDTAISNACEVINYCSQLMRDADQTVIHIRDISEAEDFAPEELAIFSGVTVKDTDLHLEKTFSNAFHETDLSRLLKERDIGFVILCGQAAEHCVVFSYNGAIEHGYSPTVLQEGVLSNTPGRAEALMEDRNVISHAAIRALIRKQDL